MEIEPDSNRLKTIKSSNAINESQEVSYDASGNMKQLQINSNVDLTWNCCNNLVKAGIIMRPDEMDDADYYNYDSNEMRTRKVSEWMVNGGKVTQKETKIYLGNYEEKRLHQKSSGEETTNLKRQTLRVMDEDSCVAIIHYWEQDDNSKEVEKAGTRSIRYQLSNHLGSVSLEVDAVAQIISYEEYFPYGGTAFIGGRNQKEVKLKEYRYSGKERDEATGLYYYGARYYAPWLGRWISCDPAGRVDGLNLYYGFVGGNPAIIWDKRGFTMKKFNEMNNDNQKIGESMVKVISELDLIGLKKSSRVIQKKEVRIVRFREEAGLFIPNREEVLKAMELGIEGDGKFKKSWRNVWKGQDETLSTASMFNILKGVGKGYSNLTEEGKDIIKKQVFISAMNRISTEYVGNETAQHSTGKNKGYFLKGNARGNQGHFDTLRRRSAIEAGLSYSQTPFQLLVMQTESNKNTLSNFAAPSLAPGYPRKSLKSRYMQTEARDILKVMNHYMGKRNRRLTQIPKCAMEAKPGQERESIQDKARFRVYGLLTIDEEMEAEIVVRKEE